MQFQSFSTRFSEGIDCVSSEKRVHEKNLATHLSHFADLVDCELWSIAFACKNYQIPFESFKWGLDRADRFKQVVEEELFSHEFLNHYQKQISKKAISSNKSPEFFLDSRFYLTFSQKQKLQSLLNSIKRKEPHFHLKEIANSLFLSSHPKKNTHKLIDALKKKLSPELHTLQEELQRMNSPLVKAKTKVSFCKNYEASDIELKVTLSKRKDLDELIKALNLWPYEKIQEKLEGKTL